jgi:redox-sensitive bicupin YhaK (pirin superfamily)
MKTVLYKAESRGHANHGWLNAYHSFSFANYYNPERMHFGVLRVLNDDTIAGGKGFDTHPHDNMEIITIPLEGDLAHKDNMGNSAVIKQGDVQVMSAGTGVYHSEFNPNENKEVKLLQIWVFPNKKNVEPRYDQVSIRAIEKQNEFYQILSPNKEDDGVWIYQDAWFSLGNFTEDRTVNYNIQKEGNGAYVFVLEGEIEIAGEILKKRDALGIRDCKDFDVLARKGTRILLMDVPMTIT